MNELRRQNNKQEYKEHQWHIPQTKSIKINELKWDMINGSGLQGETCNEVGFGSHLTATHSLLMTQTSNQCEYVCTGLCGICCQRVTAAGKGGTQSVNVACEGG